MCAFVKIICGLALGFFALQSQAASVVGLRYTGTDFDIVSIDSESGQSTPLLAHAFADLWGGSFVTDPALGVGYLITDTMNLFRYNLFTGQTLPSSHLDFGGALALGVNGQLVGARYVPGLGFDIVSINPQTGTTVTLAPLAFGDLWSGSFISDPSANIGYVITETKRLLRYNLTTGQKLAGPTLDFGGPLALAPNGKLIGIREFQGQAADIVSIDPVTGATTTLVQAAFGDFWSGTFASNLDLGIGYVLTTDNKLFQFDLVTGKRLASPLVNGGTLRSMAFASVSKYRPQPIAPFLFYWGKKRIIAHGARVVLEGETIGTVTSVHYKVGLEGLDKKATGNVRWTIRARVKAGRNRVSIRAIGPSGPSFTTRVTVVRR